jgi:hypothetical protein
MASLIANSGRTYVPLPLNGDRGFPQAFPVVFGGATYRFRLYVNASPELLTDATAILDLPKVVVVSQQILKLTGFAAGGKFTLSFRSKTTANIDYSNNAADQAAAIAQALNLTAFLGAGNSATVTPIATADAYRITFGGGLDGNALPITGTAVLPLTGAIASANVRALPAPEAFLVVRVDQDMPKGGSRIVFLRKVVPSLEYEAGAIALTFRVQRVAVGNLNGEGALGSQVTGGIAPRWA